MPPISLFPLLILLLVLTAAAAAADLAAELESLRSRSPSGVIHLDDRSVARFLTTAPTPRPYSLIIFFDAVQLRDRPDLHLRELRAEFALVSAAFSAHHLADPKTHSRVFFCDVEFGESQHSFALFGVSSLPHVRHVAPGATDLKSSDPMSQSDFSRLAESMADFAESKTGLPVGPIERPPPVSGRQMVVLAAMAAVAAPFAIRRVISGETLIHDPRIWMASAVFVYFFSVSGAMHNIIRKMPMFLSDREDPTKLVFFYQGSGMQLGAEGFAVGFLYTAVGLMLALGTHVLVKVRSVTAQRVMMLVAMFVSVWAVRKVVYLDNWKTGYSVHAYWPNSWR